jgi:hypothetical protein
MKMPPTNRAEGSGIVGCMHCNEAMSVGRAYEEVLGFRQHRAAGGANQITLGQPTGRYACSTCVDRLRIGVHPSQGSMV